MDNSILLDFMDLAIFISGFVVSYWFGLRLRKLSNKKLKWAAIISIYLCFFGYILIRFCLRNYYSIYIPYIYTDIEQSLFLGLTICFFMDGVKKEKKQ